MKNPKTREEWQAAVDAAAGARIIAACQMYGLIEGGLVVDVRRCDEILWRGQKRGVTPSQPADKLAIGLIAAMNEEANNGNETDGTTLAGR